MRRFTPALTLLAFLVLTSALPSRADSEDSIGELFLKDHATLARQSGQSGVPIACTITPRKGETVEVLSDPRVRDRLKWFSPLAIQPTTKLAQALNADSPTVVVILNAQGKVLGRCGPNDTAADFLKQLKEIGKTTRAEFLSKLGSEETSLSGCKTAAGNLVKMGGTAAELMPLLRHRSMEVRSIVTKALPTLPPGDVTLAALDGLASDDVEMRAACFQWAAKTTRATRIPPIKFWREEDEGQRKKSLAKWRELAIVDTGPLNKDILDFCEANLGKKVGGGECSHLAEAAFREVNAKPMVITGKTYVWGREVTGSQVVLPGDIVQLEDCTFKNSTAPHHTQVIRKVLGPDRYEILQQNSNGDRTVKPGELDLNKLIQGTVKIFRPVPK